MASTRREFLGGAVATGIALCGFGPAHAQSPRGERPRRGPVTIKGRRVKTVDMHAHLLVPEVWPLIEKYPQAETDIGAFLRSPMAERLTNVDTRLAEMEREGIDIQVLSLHFQHQHDWADRDLASAIAKLLNEKVAEQVAAHPDRFMGLGAVSLQHPDLAADPVPREVRSTEASGAGCPG